jgi:hypothetical protein
MIDENILEEITDRVWNDKNITPAELEMLITEGYEVDKLNSTIIMGNGEYYYHFTNKIK